MLQVSDGLSWRKGCLLKVKDWEEIDLWRAYGTDFPVDGVFYEGVQLVGLYHRPGAPKAPAPLAPKNSAPTQPAAEGEQAQPGEGGAQP